MHNGSTLAQDLNPHRGMLSCMPPNCFPKHAPLHAQENNPSESNAFYIALPKLHLYLSAIAVHWRDAGRICRVLISAWTTFMILRRPTFCA